MDWRILNWQICFASQKSQSRMAYEINQNDKSKSYSKSIFYAKKAIRMVNQSGLVFQSIRMAFIDESPSGTSFLLKTQSPICVKPVGLSQLEFNRKVAPTRFSETPQSDDFPPGLVIRSRDDFGWTPPTGKVYTPEMKYTG